MDLFLDTNIWLSFYHLSSDDLEELRKVSVLIEQRRLVLYLPDQVVDEFWRNRDNKIADAIARFKAEKLNDQFPQICKEYDEYDQMRQAIRQYREAKSRLLDKLLADYSGEQLKADQIIQELFEKAKRIEVTDDVLVQAKRRHDLGNPPGKKDSYGDAVNWECLLASVPSGIDLYFITDDQDYRAVGNQEEFSPFLRREWSTKKDSEVIFFGRLSAFFKAQFPDIQMAAELEKELLIQNLVRSSTFERTRKTLRGLVRFSDFTDAQLDEIVTAAISNNQVYWIAGDADINRYLKKLIVGNESRVDARKMEKYQNLLNGNSPDIGEDVDF
jgi:predicted nucleic acid-binding protein